MCPQTSYAINIPAVSYPGQIADAMFAKDVISSKAVAEPMPYGLLAVVDSTNTGDFANLAAKLPSAATDITTIGKAIGVVLADQARAQNPAVPLAQYPQFSCVPCARKIRAWVVTETAVVDGGRVYARFATGDNGTQRGQFGGALDVTTVGNALLASAIWRGSYAAGFAVIEMDLV